MKHPKIKPSLPYGKFKVNTFISFLFALLILFTGANSLRAQNNSSFTCPADFTRNSDPGQCGAIVNFSTSIPAGQNVTVVYNHSPGSMFPVGITNVIARAYDDNWNIISTCSFNVTVVNAGAPVISNATDITANNGKDSCGAVVHFTSPTVSVNCPFQNRTFNYTGAPQTFMVPAGVTSINVEVMGAGAGMASSSDGNVYGYPGLGGRVEAAIDVTPGQILSLNVGGAGQNASATSFGSGGYNGGADGGAYSTLYTGGGGGGASDIRTGNSTLNERIVVAGGGGASGYFGAGGNGGDLVGADGYGAGSNAGGGTQTQGGAGGNYVGTFYAANGSFGFGGSAAAGTQGGGGGGGWYGGGGGAFGDGGGGSSYTDANTSNIVHLQGYQDGNGSIVLTWSQQATLIQTAGLPSGAVFPVGTTINTFKATDAAGNFAEASFNVVVSDTQSPVGIAPANVQINTNAGSCSATNVSLGTPTYADNCGIQEVTNDAPSLFSVGNTTITWVATDIHGNISTATQTVTVVDNQNPTISTPQNIIVNTDGGSCNASQVSLATPQTSDNCGVASVTNNAPSTFLAGTTTVTWTVTDIHGNTSTATQTVTVIDNQKPTIATPQNITVNTDGGSCSASQVSLATPQTFDNCGVASVTNNAPSTFSTGTTTIIWTVTDIHGNTSTAAQTVTVEDNQNPTIIAPANVSVNLDNGSCAATNVSLGSPVTADNCQLLNVVNDARASYPVGTTVVKWTATDVNGNASTATQIVTVTDNQNPTITAPADVMVALGNGATTASNVSLGTPVTADNCRVSAVNNNAPAIYPVGTTTVTWTVTDAYGNTSTSTQKIIVTQAANQPPVITCPATTKYCFVSDANSYTVSPLVVTNSNSVKSISYTVKNAGTLVRSGTGVNASGTFTTGTNIISWTVTDNTNHILTGSTTVIIWALPTVTISTSTPDAFCNSIVLTASSTSPNVMTYEWNYNNGAFTSAQNIQLTNLNADGIYKAYVTDVNGCKASTPATYTYQKQTLLNNYTIVALKSVDLAAANTVQSGSIGLLYPTGYATFAKNFTLASAGAVVKAPYITYQNPANIPNKVYSAATFAAYPTMYFNTSSVNSLPSYTVNTNVTSTLTSQYKTLTIKKGAIVTLTNNLFGDITMEAGAQLTFTNAEVKITSLSVQQGDAAKYTTVKFSQNTKMLVSNRVDIDQRALINPDNKVVTFYMGDLRPDEEKFTIRSGDTKVTANVYMPNGKIKVKSGDAKKTCYLTGIFMAEEVDGDGENVIWNSYNCGLAMTAPSKDNIASTNLTSFDEATPQYGVKVFPNPTTGKFSIELNNIKSTKAEVIVMSVNGSVLEKRSVELTGATQYLDFNLENAAPGMYLVKVMTAEGVKTTKVLVSRK